MCFVLAQADELSTENRVPTQEDLDHLVEENARIAKECKALRTALSNTESKFQYFVLYEILEALFCAVYYVVGLFNV